MLLPPRGKLPRSVKAVAPQKVHLDRSMTGKVLALSEDQISLLCSSIQKTWFPHLTMPCLSQPQPPSPQSNPSSYWRVLDVHAASNALARVVLNTAYPPHRKVPTSDLVLTTALTASTVWEASLSPNLNQLLDHPPSGAPSKLSSLVLRIYLHLRKTVLRESIQPTSPFFPPVCSLSISTGRSTADDRRKPGLFGAWWKFPSSSVVRARVGVLMVDAGAGILVLAVVWKETLLILRTVLAL